MMSVLRRPVLFLSAAATIAVPGALAVLAVLGHGHAARSAVEQAASAASTSGVGQADMLPAAAGGPAGAGAASTAQPASGQLAPEVRGGAPAAALAAAMNQVRGAQLLTAAATAGTSASYRGVEVIANTTVGGTVTVMATVWHRGGGRTVTQTSDTTALAASQPYIVSYDGDNRAPEGVFGVTRTLVRLLATHYVAVYRGVGTVVGRPALIVEANRADGSVAARFWLDERTMLPLRKDVYDTADHLVSHDEFIQVRFGALSAPTAAASPAKVAGGAQPTWTAASSPATLLKQLNGQGCLLPGTLPGDLNLYAAAQATTASGRVVDLGFSDGLSAVSLFVQRGTLPGQLPGWQPARLAGHTVYVAQHEITLSARGFVYTLVADAPAATVDGVVGSLPPDSRPGVLGRISRGLVRLATLADPFK
ncbi:MAG TPA: sigma-E factor regulatory protein RseB domain-containing protein [Trebonia sp.]|jgi:sigma-E factor negative regulatory protein RseB|nr:sigma-E factor regulatory protein RseB domain-containing protein [Trebonia sp.]